MASTVKITAEYSSKLDSMASAIKSFLSRGNPLEIEGRVYRGIEDFCYNNTDSFKTEFIKRIGRVSNATPILEDTSIGQKFVDELAKKSGECIFLLKDTQNVLDLYQQKTDRGFGLLVNRSYFGSEEIYFELIDLIYKSLDGIDNYEDFLDRYFENFRQFIKDKNLRKKSLEIFEYVNKHTDQSIIWVDIGFQFTFTLFCYASVRFHSENSIKQDIYNFTVYPWLTDLFSGKFFTDKNELALPLELKGIDNFYSSLIGKRQGSILGFSIGDSLGFPVAGIDVSDVPRFITLPISGFEENKKHPYFDTLDAGQYTHNTNLFLISLKELIRDKGFNPDKYAHDLAIWGKDNLKENDKRWLGPTASKGIENLIDGISYKESGSKTTKSCSALYRTLPLAIFYPPFSLSESEFINMVSDSAGITHNSEPSKAAAIIATFILRDVIFGIDPKTAVEASVKSVHETEAVSSLIEKVNEAIVMSEKVSDDEARKYFGTGSPVHQMLPLSIFFFLKYKDNFEDGILAAANSFRNDSDSEKKRLTGLSWEQQLIAAEGGNTDGIAAVVGSFLGAHLGIGDIPKGLLGVENSEYLKELATKI